MKILSLGDVPELKNLAKENGFTLHVRDACGGQAFSLSKNSNADDAFYQKLEDFFSKLNMEIVFHDKDKLNFTIK